MSQIMCAQKLWRVLRQAGLPPRRAPPPSLAGARLDSWALRSFDSDDGIALAVALNEATYLTLVFELAPLDTLRQRLATALEHALVDLGVDLDVACDEAVCIDFLPFTRLTNRKMASALAESRRPGSRKDVARAANKVTRQQDKPGN